MAAVLGRMIAAPRPHRVPPAVVRAWARMLLFQDVKVLILRSLPIDEDRLIGWRLVGRPSQCHAAAEDGECHPGEEPAEIAEWVRDEAKHDRRDAGDVPLTRKHENECAHRDQ